MKKIINGRLYNTDTAKEVGSYSNCLGYGDFRFLNESLYRKKTGEFFLYGEGGPMTRYAVRDGDMWAGGEDITPMSVESAKKWAEEYLSADEYEGIFGPVSEEDPKYKVFSANLTIEDYTKLKSMSESSGRSMSAILCELIEKA